MFFKILLFFILLVSPALSVSLEGAIQHALENNKNIIIQEAELESSFGVVKEFQSIYDPSLNIELFHIDSTIPSTSAFAKNNVINEDLTYTNLGIEGYLPTGTRYTLFNVGLSKAETDLGTSAISPKWEADLEFSIRQNLLKDFGPEINNSKILMIE